MLPVVDCLIDECVAFIDAGGFGAYCGGIRFDESAFAGSRCYLSDVFEHLVQLEEDESYLWSRTPIQSADESVFFQYYRSLLLDKRRGT